MTIRGTWDDWAPWLAERGGELKTSVVFLTRLPVPRALPIGGLDIAPAVWAFPLAGIAVGAIGAVVYAVADRLATRGDSAQKAIDAHLRLARAMLEDALSGWRFRPGRPRRLPSQRP